MRKVLFIAIIGLLFASCEKDNGDYRDDFVGVYACVVESYSFDAPSGDYRNETYLDTIEVGMVDDSVLTFFSVKDAYSLDKKGGYYVVDNEGYFELHNYNWETQITGRFFDDSIFIRHSYSHKGLVGFVDTIQGKKTKEINK